MDKVADASTASDAMAWHALSADEVVKRLATDRLRGLEADEA
jgi:hypothetical protein